MEGIPSSNIRYQLPFSWKLWVGSLEQPSVMRPIRNRDPETYRLITIRTSEARLWLTPSSNVAKLVGGVLARYQELLEIVTANRDTRR